MLSLFKKKNDAARANQALAWHPNFRNYERLPDTKAVRTSFFINSTAIVVSLLLVGYTVKQEYVLSSLNSQIAAAADEIARDKSESARVVADFAKFKAEEKKLVEVDAFLKTRPIFSDLLLRVGQTLPENIALDSIALRENTLNLRATVKGAPEIAAGYASDYVERIRANEDIEREFDSVELLRLNRIASSGQLAIEIELKLKGTSKK